MLVNMTSLEAFGRARGGLRLELSLTRTVLLPLLLPPPPPPLVLAQLLPLPLPLLLLLPLLFLDRLEGAGLLVRGDGMGAGTGRGGLLARGDDGAGRPPRGEFSGRLDASPVARGSRGDGGRLPRGEGGGRLESGLEVARESAIRAEDTRTDLPLAGFPPPTMSTTFSIIIMQFGTRDAVITPLEECPARAQG